MKNDILVHTTIPNDTLKELCIKNYWFTVADNVQQDKLFAINDTYPTIRELALVIMICTNTHFATLNDIVKKLEIAHEEYVKPYRTALFIDGKWQFIDELRQGYRIITGLSDDEMTDEEIWEYMLNVINEEDDE